MATPAEALMLLGPREIARRIEYKNRPWWSVWYGRQTRLYWAVACWVRTPDAMLSAATPEALDAAIANFEAFHPKPGQQHRLAVGH
jgi:hypothetical protein